MTDPVRDEAERLVAAAIAAVSVAARGLSDGRPLANGSAECCVCPVCRVISAMREPSPELTERIATGAGELAAGVTSLLRAFGRPAAPGPDESEGDEFWDNLRHRARGADGTGDPWHAATTEHAGSEPAPGVKKSVVKKAVAKKAVKKAVPPVSPPALHLVPDPELDGESPPRPAVPAKKAAKKAVAKKATPSGDGP